MINTISNNADDNSVDDTKVYTRTFDPGSSESLALVAKQIAPGSRVLDVGCGAGDLGEYLRREKNCTVVGVDYSAASLAVAAEKLDATLQIDLNVQQLHEHVEEVFDVIVMADILEHINNPQAVLNSANNCLSERGKIVISIPNAAYLGVLLSLYDDEWQYREEGILDSTHVRFYTKKSVMQLLQDSDFDGYICDRVSRDLLDSDFHQRVDSQVDSVRDWLLAKPEGSTYQFIIEARPLAQRHRFPAPHKAPPMSLQHIVKIYWQADALEDFNTVNYAIQRGEMGKKNWLRFAVGSENIHKIRLHFADRRGTYLIDQIRIFDGDKLLWTTQGNDYSTALHDTNASHKRLPMSATAYRAEAFVLIMLEEIVHGKELSIEVIINAPVSELNNAFIDSVPLALYQQLHQEHRQLAVDRQAMVEQLQLARNTIAERDEQLQQANVEHDAVVQQHVLAFDELQQQQQQLLSSSSWQLTAPLRVISGLFKKS